MNRTRTRSGAESRPRGPSDAPPAAGGLALPLIVGSSPRMQRIFNLIGRIAPTDSSVLITGESGTGKELIARSIHLQSRRADGPFMAVNCGALPENLLESELFGHVRGAFTGAWTDKKGLFEQADRGTLFLDEVGEMPPSSQVKLLRVLQDNEIRRVGGATALKVDVRILAATNRDLRKAIETGLFREDLYYRLNVFQIDLPPLRDRGDDIPLLAHFFLDVYARRMGKTLAGFDPAAVYQLTHYEWPGNIRELENVVQRAVALAEGDLVGVEDLPRHLREARIPLIESPGAHAAGAPEGHGGAHPGLHPGAPSGAHPGAPPGTTPITAAPGSAIPDGLTLEAVEKLYIEQTLRQLNGNASAAARSLGVSRSTLWRKMKQYGIKT